MNAQEFKAARLKLGLSAAEFARLLGFSDVNAIEDIESGKQIPNGPTVKILKVLDSLPENQMRSMITNLLSI